MTKEAFLETLAFMKLFKIVNIEYFFKSSFRDFSVWLYMTSHNTIND